MNGPPDDDFFADHTGETKPVSNVHSKVISLADFRPMTDKPWEPRVVPVPNEWWSMQPRARKWLLRDGRTNSNDGLLPLGKTAQMVAEGGAGKTMLLAQLSISIATGDPWLGAFHVGLLDEPDDAGRQSARKGRTLLILGEEDAEEVHRRLYNARRAMRSPIPESGRIVVLPLAGIPSPMLERGPNGKLVAGPFADWLIRWAEKNGPWDLIGIDPLSRFAGPDAEKDNAAATQFIQSLEAVASVTGATVMASHHTNKLARDGSGAILNAVAGRGSSALSDGARWQCALGVERLPFKETEEKERLGRLVCWSHTKTNYSLPAADLWLRSDRNNGGVLLPLDESDQAKVDALRGKAQSEVAKQQAKDAMESAADAALLVALAGGAQYPTRELLGFIKASAKCGQDKAETAIYRALNRDILSIDEGPRGAKLYSLKVPGPSDGD